MLQFVYVGAHGRTDVPKLAISLPRSCGEVPITLVVSLRFACDDELPYSYLATLCGCSIFTAMEQYKRLTV